MIRARMIRINDTITFCSAYDKCVVETAVTA